MTVTPQEFSIPDAKLRDDFTSHVNLHAVL